MTDKKKVRGEKARSTHISPSDIERVMEVAGRLFAEKSYDGVGIRQIAEESGVKAPSIFYHFGSKGALYEEVLEYKYRATIARITLAIKPLRDPRQKLECIIGTVFDLFQDRTFLMLLHRDLADIVANQRRSGFLGEYRNFFKLTSTVLQGVFDRAADQNLVFPLASTILGYCELTAAMSEEHSGDEGAEWLSKQRDELIVVCKRICQM